VPGFYIARTGIIFRIGHMECRAIGFGCSADRAVARTSSMWEMFERLLMTAEVTGRPERLVQGRKPDGGVVVRKAFNEVVPRPWQSTYRIGCDATGLAIHRSVDDATVVAIAELVERAINAQAWYGPEPTAMNLHISAQMMAPGVELDIWSATVDEIGSYSLASLRAR
jgi:ribosomal protein S12 methylthiotransferase accessory factor YcaO